MKKSILLMMMIGVIFLGTACGAGAKYADYGMKTLMEASTADWVKTIEKDCKITGFGRPYGTVKETLDKDEKENGLESDL